MEWSDLQIVAVDGLLADTGVAIRSPIVRDSCGRVFVVRDPDVASPEPGLLISAGELQAHLQAELWVDLSSAGWAARRGSAVLVASRRFATAAKAVAAQDPRSPFAKVEFGAGTTWYVDRAEISRWFLATARTLNDHANVQLCFFRSTRADQDAERALEWLDQARYVCRLRSPELKANYQLLKLLFRLKQDARRVAVVDEVLAREFPVSVPAAMASAPQDNDARQPYRIAA